MVYQPNMVLFSKNLDGLAGETLMEFMVGGWIPNFVGYVSVSCCSNPSAFGLAKVDRGCSFRYTTLKQECLGNRPILPGKTSFGSYHLPPAPKVESRHEEPKEAQEAAMAMGMWHTIPLATDINR